MTLDLWWLAYPLLGAFVGFMAGLLGVGGGGIMVPLLTTLFLAQGFARDQVVHMALGTSMAAIVLTSAASLRVHHAHGAVRWDVVRTMTPGILLGTFGGTFIAARIDALPLAIFFSAFMGFIALQMFLNVRPKPTRQLPGTLGRTGAGVGIGVISALVAIGGGSLTVPFLTWCNILVRHAIGTSAAIGLPIALAGTMGYLINGWDWPGLPPLTLGFVYIPALIGLSLVSMLTAPIGARLSHRLPVPVLKRIFAVVLLLLSARMLQSLLG